MRGNQSATSSLTSQILLGPLMPILYNCSTGRCFTKVAISGSMDGKADKGADNESEQPGNIDMDEASAWCANCPIAGQALEVSTKTKSLRLRHAGQQNSPWTACGVSARAHLRGGIGAGGAASGGVRDWRRLRRCVTQTSWLHCRGRLR